MINFKKINSTLAYHIFVENLSHVLRKLKKTLNATWAKDQDALLQRQGRQLQVKSDKYLSK